MINPKYINVWIQPFILLLMAFFMLILGIAAEREIIIFWSVVSFIIAIFMSLINIKDGFY